MILRCFIYNCGKFQTDTISQTVFGKRICKTSLGKMKTIWSHFKQPFNLSSFRAIFGSAIFYGSSSDFLKFSVSLSAWRVAEVFSHSLISNKNCLLWTSNWISRFSFWQCVTKSNQLTITWHIEMKLTSAAIFIFRREQIKRFSLYKQGTDARRLHYFYGLLFKNKG